MKIDWVRIEGYRSYSEPAELRVSPITVLVGPNGIGKSSVLEALDLFFNKTGYSRDSDPAVDNAEDIQITVAFSDLPEGLQFDEEATTSFTEEPYLLNQLGRLVVRKTYKRDGTLTQTNPSVSLLCNVMNTELAEAIGETNTQLKRRIKEIHLERECDQTINSSIRKALYRHYRIGNTDTHETWVDVQKRQSALDAILPYFALFKSDRLNSSKDAEVSEPVKYAISTALKQVTEEAKPLIEQVGKEIQDILNRANATLAESFGDAMPAFSASVEDDLAKAFSASLNDARGIPLEKQGSGVRRLYMFNLLISEAKRKALEARRGAIIYGIEEPETSQHPDFQKKLIAALKMLSEQNQVLVTTHNPNLLSQFEKDSIRIVRAAHPKILDCKEAGVLAAVVQELGILPDPLPNASFRALLVVEGPTDLIAIAKLRLRHPVLDAALRHVWIVHGGGDTIRDWARAQHFCDAGVPQFFLVDSDYGADGSYGQTRRNVEKALAEIGKPELQYLLPFRRREIEQYLHPDAIKRVLTSRGISTTGLDALIVQLDDTTVPAKDVFNGIGGQRVSLLPFSTPHERGLTIQQYMNSSGLSGYSFSGSGYKRLAADIIFEEMTDAEVAERFQYPDASGATHCELSQLAGKITAAMAAVG